MAIIYLLNVALVGLILTVHPRMLLLAVCLVILPQISAGLLVVERVAPFTDVRKCECGLMINFIRCVRAAALKSRFEEELKRLNPNIRSISYELIDLNNYLDRRVGTNVRLAVSTATY